ncbi:hypothetical protein G647_09118 [Cladophialophora carrionii CBS 160.54]|uniref:DUF1750-domain-containing protein n=1 Tax=Cladophialophora carrionii CBS 160.54 TaxID=1279043 RepID=V9CY40_9EURO|nr:uncharacterized protein G647_09118 [Cladophialophora carrionii CBS 160.54]ETI19286.1 hypothetical protein G647_09118 [Cladophialophora carrionii CBS 160.54]
MNQMMKDPAAGVPAQLLPHLHLVSKYRYPITSNPAVDTIVGYLLEAPKIVRDLQPMQWQFIDTPPDGSLILEWQPLEYLGTSYASDGFIWADVEHVYKSEVRGYTLEMLLQRAGYRASGEAMATHCRRRYRLLPGNPTHGLPNPDPSLWLTHYSKASARDHVPAASIPILPHVHALIQQRRLIQSQGQLPRKEFMLHDRSNWPVIHLPPGVARAAAQGQIPPGAGHRRGASIAQEATLEEEEDVSRGDLLDFMTLRDISRVRYEQHHEWMEEIIESPYPTLSIIPSDLGFGRKGQLEELTKDFFDAPVAATREPNTGPPPRVGKMPSGQAEDFIKRASDKLVAMQTELEEMRKKHARRMEKLRRSTTLTTAEKKLRTVSNGPERQSISKDAANGLTDSAPRDAIDEIMGTVEADMGQKLTKTTTVTLISKGGLEERKQISPAPVATSIPTLPRSQSAINPAVSVDASIQQHVPPQPSPSIAQEQKPQQEEIPTPVGGPQTPSQPAPAAAEGESRPSAAEPSQPPAAEQPPQPDANPAGDDLPQLDDIGTDVNMEGMVDHVDSTDRGGDEWVMIGEDGGQNDDIPEIQTEGAQDLVQPSAEEAAAHASGHDTDLQQLPQAQLTQDAQLNTPDFDMGGDFDNVEVDTAGDALASYGNDEDLNLENMEGSAFGDAFHTEDEEIS